MTKKSEISFATTDDLAASWQPLDSEQTERAEVILLQASNYLRQIAYNNGQDIDDNIAADSTGVYGANVKMVICAATQRLMAAPVDIVPDATQWSQSATPYSESMSFGGNISGSIYFKDKELKLLGLGSVSGRPNISILRGVR